MSTERTQHTARSWRVHEVAPDFKLLDVWRFDLGGTARLDPFLDVLWQAGRDASGSALARLRTWLGRKLHWDAHLHTLPIPGCTETTVSARLTETDRAANRAQPAAPSPLPAADPREVYRFATEALYEVSNDTIHALLHVGIVDGDAVLAVYIKSRGLGSQLYMAMIAPARHLVVYPRLIASVERRWRAPTPVTSSAS